MPALVIQFFWPLITHSSPSLTALVRIEEGSDPASGSDSAKAGEISPVARRGKNRSFCSSVPNSVIGSEPSSWIIRISALEAQAIAISSTATWSISVPVPVPPYSVENGRPRMSCSPSSLRMSQGYSPVASISAARGRIFASTTSRITSRKSRISCGSS